MDSPAHQWSAAVPTLLVVSAPEGVNTLRSTPSILSTLQELVDEALADGVWITRAGKSSSRCASIRLAVTAALSREECERTAGVIKAAVAKVLAKRNECAYPACRSGALPYLDRCLVFSYTRTLLHSDRTLQSLYSNTCV